MESDYYLSKMLSLTKELTRVDYFVGSSQLSKTEFRLFREVIAEREKGKKIISSELARRLGVTRSAVSQIVTKLEAKNIIKRTSSPTDRKIAYIELSDYAAEAFREQCERASDFMNRAVARFGEERMQKMFGEFEAFAAICEEIKKEVSAK